MPTKYAIPSQDGSYVAGFFDAPDGIEPFTLYGDVTNGWKKLTAAQAKSVQPGYDFNTLKPATPKPATPEELVQTAWMIRAFKEQAVLNIGDVRVQGGKDTADRLTSILAYLSRHPGEKVDFSFGDSTAKLGADDIGAIADIVGAHTQKVFATYAAAIADIKNGSITTREQIEALNWI